MPSKRRRIRNGLWRAPTNWPRLAPAAGHLVHMPAHVYIRTGDYEAAVKTNEKAADVDRAYIKSSGAQGIYPMMYYSHNLHFHRHVLRHEWQLCGSQEEADMLAAHVGPHVKEMPPLEGFMTIPMAVDIRSIAGTTFSRCRSPIPT